MEKDIWKQKEIILGNIDFNNKGKNRNLVTIDMELHNHKEGLVLSIRGNVWNHNHSDVLMCGQCLDELLPYFKEDEKFLFIYDMWKKYHLNDLHAGTPEQETLLKEAVKNGELSSYGANNYKETCEYLKQHNLYEVEVKGKPYRYGSGWLFEEIPLEDLAKMVYFIENNDVIKDDKLLSIYIENYLQDELLNLGELKKEIEDLERE